MDKTERDKIISEYRAAYMRAHGRCVRVTYRQGYAYVGDPSAPYRIRSLVGFTETLNRRADARARGNPQ